MGVLDQRRKLKALAARLNSRAPLNDGQRRWLANALAQVADGIDANKAFGVKLTRGHSLRAETARWKLSLALLAVANEIEAGAPRQAALATGVAVWRGLHGVDPNESNDEYGIDALTRAWNKHKDWRRPRRRSGEADFPF